jgi:hypothetical protein
MVGVQPTWRRVCEILGDARVVCGLGEYLPQPPDVVESNQDSQGQLLSDPLDLGYCHDKSATYPGLERIYANPSDDQHQIFLLYVWCWMDQAQKHFDRKCDESKAFLVQARYKPETYSFQWRMLFI